MKSKDSYKKLYKFKMDLIDRQLVRIGIAYKIKLYLSFI